MADFQGMLSQILSQGGNSSQYPNDEFGFVEEDYKRKRGIPLDQTIIKTKPVLSQNTILEALLDYLLGRNRRP